MIVFYLTRFQYSQIEQGRATINDLDKSISHNHRARIDPQNYFRSLLQPALYFYKINEALAIQQNLYSLPDRPPVNGVTVLDHLVTA